MAGSFGVEVEDTSSRPLNAVGLELLEDRELEGVRAPPFSTVIRGSSNRVISSGSLPTKVAVMSMISSRPDVKMHSRCSRTTDLRIRVAKLPEGLIWTGGESVRGQVRLVNAARVASIGGWTSRLGCRDRTWSCLRELRLRTLDPTPPDPGLLVSPRPVQRLLLQALPPEPSGPWPLGRVRSVRGLLSARMLTPCGPPPRRSSPAVAPTSAPPSGNTSIWPVGAS